MAKRVRFVQTTKPAKVPEAAPTVGEWANEIAARQALSPGHGRIVTGNPDGNPVQVGFGGGYLPLRNVTLDAISGTDIRPVGAIGTVLYGARLSDGALYRSLDDGATWGLVSSGVSGVNNIMPLGNGEVIVSGTGALYRSTGWASNPLTATWTQCATATPGAAFIPMGLDVHGAYVLVGEYAVPYTPSKKMRFSSDYGVTFTELLNLDTLYPADIATTHWHAACIDHWADTPSGVRLWASNGDGPHAMRYSDDLGATWTLFSTHWQPTGLTATPAGIVMTTDETPDGVYRILRTPDPADMVVEPMHLIRYGGGPGALYGFATRSTYHAQTGLVYISFRSDQILAPGLVLVSDGLTADTVYESPWSGVTSACDNVSVVDGGSVHWYLRNDGTTTEYHAHAEQVARGGKTTEMLGAGGQLTGRASEKTDVAIGAKALAVGDSVVIGVDADGGAQPGENVTIGHLAKTLAYQAVALGKAAVASAHHAVAAGFEAHAMDEGATAVGRQAVAYVNAVAIGVNAKSGEVSTTKGLDGVAIGKAAVNESASGGIAIGANAHLSTGASAALAIGVNAEATNYGGTVVGTGASADGNQAMAIGVNATTDANTGAMAIGGGATATHQDAIAIGRNAATTFDNQVQLGARHIELVEMSDPPPPATNGARLFVRDNGSGKSQLCVRFASGAVQVIATEP